MLFLAETSFEFANPWAFLLLGLIPLLMVLKGKKGQQGAVMFSSLHILNRLGPMTRSRAGGFRIALMMLALGFGILALTRPQWVDKKTKTTESGIELILAIDVSRSMQVEDFEIGGTKANRLDAAKKVTREFIRGRKSDRIGLLAFAGRPYLASPLTVSREWLEGDNGLGRVRIGLVEDGTAIGSAIAAAAKRLDKRPAKSKVVVLLTDGVNNSGKLSPIEAAKLAKTLGIKIYTIAVGTYGDYTVQTPRGPQMLRQEFDEETLQQIATIADGDYFRAQDTSGLESIFSQIDKLEKTEVKTRTSVSADELFYWPAFVAFIFGLLSLIGGETFWRRFP